VRVEENSWRLGQCMDKTLLLILNIYSFIYANFSQTLLFYSSLYGIFLDTIAYGCCYNESSIAVSVATMGVATMGEFYCNGCCYNESTFSLPCDYFVTNLSLKKKLANKIFFLIFQFCSDSPRICRFKYPLIH
jgi:hypothetical protein